jgi:hypothetical protein
MLWIFAAIHVLLATCLWARIATHWKTMGGALERYGKLVAVLIITLWTMWFIVRADRYWRLEKLRERMAPTIERAVRHALEQPGTTPEERREMDRRIRREADQMIREQIDHE